MRARPKRKRNPSPFFVRPAWDHHCTEVPMKSRGVSDPPEALFQDFKPVLVFCAILGIFPLQLRRTGDAHFKWFSRSMLYSGVFYTLVGCFDLWLARRRLYDIVYNTHSFTTTIFKYNFFVYLVPHLILFPTHWLEGRKLAAFRNKWWEFQTSFFRVTGRSLSFGLRKTSWLVVVILPLFSALYIGVVEVMTSEFTTAELFFYWYMLTLLVLHLVVWYMCCTALATSARQLGNLLQLAVIDGSGDVSNYRVLWLQLSELTKMTGSSNTYVQGQLLLEYFATILLSLYSIMIGMFENRISSITLSQGLNGIFWSLVVLVMCNSAGWAQWQVGPVFIGRLSELLHYGRAVDQLETFLQVASCNQPIISLQGYVTLDRSLFTTLASTVVTYLVVLLQFGSKDREDDNVDKYNFTTTSSQL